MGELKKNNGGEPKKKLVADLLELHPGQLRFEVYLGTYLGT